VARVGAVKLLEKKEKKKERGDLVPSFCAEIGKEKACLIASRVRSKKVTGRQEGRREGFFFCREGEEEGGGSFSCKGESKWKKKSGEGGTNVVSRKERGENSPDPQPEEHCRGP